MISKIIISLILLVSNFCLAQNQAPVVENVRFEQRTDGSFIVDIYYDVNDPNGDAMTISVQVSDDKGTTWDFTANNISGDITEVFNGTNKHIVWDYGSEHPNTFSDQFRIKIIADDGVGGIPCPGNEKVYYEGGPNTDGGGDYYNTVQIGNQCWLKENLNIGVWIRYNEFPTDNGKIEKYCYGNTINNCNKFGGLYKWWEAMQYPTTSRAQGICPNNWHIPSYEETVILKNAVGDNSNSLKELDQGIDIGAGNNSSGFSALLGGYRFWDRDLYKEIDISARFWTSSDTTNSWVSYITLMNNDDIIYLDNTVGNFGFSVRCLKD